MERKQRYKLIKTKHAWLRVAAATTFMIGGLVLGGNSVFADTNVPAATDTSTLQAPVTLAQEQTASTDQGQAEQPQAQATPEVSTDTAQAPADQPATTQTEQAQTQSQSTLQASTMILASDDPNDPGNALLNQAWIQTGVLTQDMKGVSGHIYKAGTKVSRASRVENDFSGEEGNVWYLSCDVEQFVFQGYGTVSNDYVKQTSEYHVTDLQNGDVWGSQSAVNSEDAYGSLTPVNGTPSQSVDKSALQVEIGQAQAIDLSQYTDTSAQNVKSALDTAENVNDNANASQTDIDNATDTLKTAINGLVKKVTPSNPVIPTDNTGNNGEVTPATPVTPDEGNHYNQPSQPSDSDGSNTPTDNTEHNGEVKPVIPANDGKSNNNDSDDSSNIGHNGVVTPDTPTNDNNQDVPSNVIGNNDDEKPTNHVMPNDNNGGVTPSNPETPTDNVSQATDTASTADKQIADQPVGRHFSDDTSVDTTVTDNYVPQHAAQADNQANALPQTGQSNDSTLTISGIVAVIASLLLGLGSFFKFRKEN